MPPTVVAVGTADNAVAGGWNPGLPAGWQQDDILLIVVENTGGEGTIAATGYAHVSSDGTPVSPVVQGVNTQLSVLWKRAGASESGPAVTGPVDHALTQMIAVRGCPLSGNPWNMVGVGSEATSDTSALWPGVVTTVADTLVLEIIASSQDSATAPLGATPLTNGNYASITTRMNVGIATGNGGAIGLVSATFAGTGATGQSTGTLQVAGFKALMTLAMRNAPRRPDWQSPVSFPPIDRAASW
jgi:hypothetical protein